MNEDKDIPMYKKLIPGTQILYVPTHTNGDLDHPDVEAGFVTSYRPESETVFYRYFSKYDPDELRTKANSEGAPLANIVIKDTKAPIIVETRLAEILKEQAAQNARKPY